MDFHEPLSAAVRSLKANKLRSGLTALGIIIGVAAVIIVVSLVEGLKGSVLKEVEKAGSQTLFVRPIFRGEIPDDEFAKLKDRDLTLDHMRALARETAVVNLVTPLFFTATQVKMGGKSTSTQLIMTDDSYLDTNGLGLSRGRYFVPSDLRLASKVAVIGTSLIDKLGIKGNPVGQYLSTDTLQLEIIGVVEEQGGGLTGDSDDRVIIPLSTGMGILSEAQRRMLFFQARVDPHLTADDGGERVEESLRRIKGIKAGQPSSFKVFSPKQITSLVSGITSVISSVAGGMVSIALLVGGIGIMNIMLVSVTERTREIGIRKAVGAKRRDVLLQFLIEAALLCVLGGTIGISMGYVGGAILGKVFFGQVGGIPLWAVLSAFGVPACIGLLFGMYPASKASKLDPIEALRYE